MNIHIQVREKVELLTQKLINIENSLKAKNIDRKMIKNNLKNAKKDVSGLESLFYSEQEKIENIKSIGSNFKKKIAMSLEFLKSVETFVKVPVTGGIYGSFVRQIFELPFSLENFGEDLSFGNPIGHDVDIALFNSKPDNNTILNVIKFMEFTQQYIKLSEISNGTLQLPKVGEYQIIEIKETTINSIKNNDPLGKRSLFGIPKYLIKFLDSSNKTIVSDIIMWFPIYRQEVSGDYDVNSLILCDRGIYTQHNTNFYSILNHINKREAECLIDFTKLQSVLKTGLPKTERIPSLSTIGTFIANRFKILSFGYKNITSKYGVPEFEIENEEHCYITQCEPPYINLIFECKHKMSVVGYIGQILMNNCQYSEAYSCPQCRKDFLLNIINKPPSETSYWTPFIISKREEIYESEKSYKKINILGEECKKTIKDYYKEETEQNHNINFIHSPLTINDSIHNISNIMVGQSDHNLNSVGQPIMINNNIANPYGPIGSIYTPTSNITIVPQNILGNQLFNWSIGTNSNISLVSPLENNERHDNNNDDDDDDNSTDIS